MLINIRNLNTTNNYAITHDKRHVNVQMFVL